MRGKLQQRWALSGDRKPNQRLPEPVDRTLDVGASVQQQRQNLLPVLAQPGKQHRRRLDAALSRESTVST
jgi:hypothetical protein